MSGMTARERALTWVEGEGGLEHGWTLRSRLEDLLDEVVEEETARLRQKIERLEDQNQRMRTALLAGATGLRETVRAQEAAATGMRRYLRARNVWGLREVWAEVDPLGYEVRRVEVGQDWQRAWIDFDAEVRSGKGPVPLRHRWAMKGGEVDEGTAVSGSEWMWEYDRARQGKPVEACGAYYGVGDGTGATCVRREDHPPSNGKDEIGHSSAETLRMR